jgi:hypothetical protein
MSEKVTGYILLASGIAIILFSMFSLIFVFTKRAEPIQLFNLKGISLDASSLTPQMDLSNVPGVKIPQKTQKPPPIEIMPAESINFSANIFAHLMFMGFLISVGSKIATLGTNLLRPIIVKSSKKIDSE